MGTGQTEKGRRTHQHQLLTVAGWAQCVFSSCLASCDQTEGTTYHSGTKQKVGEGEARQRATTRMTRSFAKARKEAQAAADTSGWTENPA